MFLYFFDIITLPDSGNRKKIETLCEIAHLFREMGFFLEFFRDRGGILHKETTMEDINVSIAILAVAVTLFREELRAFFKLK